jgi:hypothetical protein
MGHRGCPYPLAPHGTWDQLEARRLIEDKHLIADAHVEWRGSPLAKPANFTEAVTLDNALERRRVP